MLMSRMEEIEEEMGQVRDKATSDHGNADAIDEFRG